MDLNPADFLSILPVLVLVVWACILLLADLFIKNKLWTAVLSGLGLAVTLVVTLLMGGTVRTGFGGMVSQDGFAVFVSALLLASGIVAIGISYGYGVTFKRVSRKGRGFTQPALAWIPGGWILVCWTAKAI